MKYVAENYKANNLILSVAGPMNHTAIVKKAEALFRDLDKGTARGREPAQYRSGTDLINRKTEQAHVVLGFRGISRQHPSYAALRLLSALLGGGMSSRLFQEIREKRGLAYSVYSFFESYQDDGLFGIYTGTGPEHIKEFMPIILKQLRDVTQNVSEKELARAKAQIKSNILMARESMTARADQQARYLIYFNKAYNVQNTIEKIDAVTLDDIHVLARDIFLSKPALAAIGPLKGLMSLSEIEKQLA
jgi:predicted Zn-dependent peptidase